ncbi:2,3-diphosphoglycerate-dependent phosphoglycerate mutase [Martelella alba]|uniref:2,3-bisphosphoglycerate-dependent phosphoglycerate mutase n=1 Tax=Martelella alba TaxID=2590451 RepID=A0ABY2SH81_9HYPH|nr:2,3-diphosphoglycerate-dependent phosphoglycerate mutase [Martelella alba]TKI03967.1 2,3-diphosphoglycerate-dependent phosphoglycerate mutase [Martelella alba]
MPSLVLLRHGESLWNKENRFTGWTDIPLTHKGRDEARHAASLMKKDGMVFDAVCASVLTRTIHTAWIILDEMQSQWLPVDKSWRLNERHYGALQGLNKTETAERFGNALVQQWRGSYDIPPPAMSLRDPRYAGRDRRYAHLAPENIPVAESLKMTVDRVSVYWRDTLFPRLNNGERLLVIAHKNSLRALIKYISRLSATEIGDVHIPTGIPIMYEFDKNGTAAKPYFLGKTRLLI